MNTPPHFSSSAAFNLYVLNCALRDREAYLAAIANADWMDTDRQQTGIEIKCIREKIRRLKKWMRKPNTKSSQPGT